MRVNLTMTRGGNMATITKPRERVISETEHRRARMVLFWAAIGALAIGMQAYAYLGWVLSGQAKRVPTGPTEVPFYMRTFLSVQEIVGVTVLAVFIYWFLVRPWRRERRLTWDGMFLI